MKRPTPIRRHIFAGLGIAGLTLLGLATPYFVSHDSSDVVINTAAVMAADSHQYKITEPVALLGVAHVVVESGTLGLSERTRKTVQGRASIDKIVERGGAHLTLNDARIAINLEMSGTQQATSAQSFLGPLATALASMKFGSLAISDSSIVLHDDHQTIEVLDDVEAQVRHSGLEHLVVTGSFRMRGQKLDFSTTLNAGEAALQERRLPVQAKFSGALIEASLRGHLSVGNRARLSASNSELKLSDLGKAARWLGLGWPERSAIQAFSSTGMIDWSAGVLVFQDAVFNFDGNRAAGAMTFNYQAERPQVDSTLAFDQLDLTNLLTSETPREISLIEATVRKSSDWLPVRLGLRPEALATPLLRAVDADLRLSAERVQISSLQLGRSAAAISMRDGKMLADLAEIEFDGGGEGAIQISLDTNSADLQLGVRGRLQGVELGNISAALLGEPILSGLGDVVIDINAAGDQYDQLLESLSGRIEAKSVEGAALSVDLAKLVAQHSEGNLRGWGTSAGLTPVTDLDVKLSFANGRGQMETFSAKAGSQRLVGTGAIDVAARSLDAKLWIGLDAPTSEDEAQMGDLVEFRGDWHAPDISISRAPSRQASQPDQSRQSQGG